jgi:hypothetical protein
VIRPAGALCALLLLTGCSQAGANTENPNDPYSGLAPQILAWRTDIEASHPACQTKVGGKGCESFEVTCKGAENLTPADAAKGVTAKVVAAMEFSAKTADGSTGKSGSAFAEFSKTGGQWTRTEAKPVNPQTCAAF